MIIEINNQTSFRLKEDFLKKVAGKVLAEENKKELELSVALVSRSKIKELNKRYLKKNRPTDVLSFFYGDSGELAICLSEVKKNAKNFNLKFEKELTKILIHGILHLAGYEHERGGDDARKMEERQEYYLSQF